MKDIIFLQFYSENRTLESFEMGNGFSDTFDFCKSKGDFLWVNHEMPNYKLETLGYSSNFIINKGTVYVSASYVSHLYQVYLWALRYKDINFIVGGPVISSNCFTVEEDLPKNISLINNSVEDYFGISNFSQPWRLEVPSSIPDNKIITFSYTIENKCYWKRCKFCTFSKYKGNMAYRQRKNFDYEFKDMDYNGKKDVRIGSDAITPFHIKEVIPNIPYLEEVRYRAFMRATAKELVALRKTKNINNVRFTIGLEFPTERMWKYVDKGYKREDVLEIIKFLSDNKVSVVLGTIVGWNNLIKEDIKQLKKFMNDLTVQNDCILMDHILFISANTKLHDIYKKGKESKYGPFYMGFYPKLETEQLKLNNEARSILVDWTTKQNLKIVSR